MPVFEGPDDKYWLGGNSKLLHHMIFPTKRAALRGLEAVKQRILAFHAETDLFVREIDKIEVRRAELIAK